MYRYNWCCLQSNVQGERDICYFCGCTRMHVPVSIPWACQNNCRQTTLRNKQATNSKDGSWVDQLYHLDNLVSWYRGVTGQTISSTGGVENIDATTIRILQQSSPSWHSRFAPIRCYPNFHLFRTCHCWSRNPNSSRTTTEKAFHLPCMKLGIFCKRRSISQIRSILKRKSWADKTKSSTMQLPDMFKHEPHFMGELVLACPRLPCRRDLIPQKLT